MPLNETGKQETMRPVTGHLCNRTATSADDKRTAPTDCQLPLSIITKQIFILTLFIL